MTRSIFLNDTTLRDGCNDASRADRNHLARVIETAARAGASRVRLADRVGVLDPF
ncbi:isopropylmalate/homocitrate/citramalate synthase [Rhizobium mongolense]|uniref:Isopropylmalate/homocitrate/citramalate synthase n=1 Tax=Rhizobium mongolense TaxID=57676 RepID=A0A7W6WFV0_9HYPH|nr:isopropylmalate/homocitrate/citramalate synthase [Rhizobium mongolense]